MHYMMDVSYCLGASVVMGRGYATTQNERYVLLVHIYIYHAPIYREHAVERNAEYVRGYIRAARGHVQSGNPKVYMHLILEG
jgi:hypothetical protein